MLELDCNQYTTESIRKITCEYLSAEKELKRKEKMENWENIQLPWPDWTITAYLGGGGYGKVYQIERTVSGLQEEAALKIISRPADDQEIEAYYDNGYDAESMVATYTDELQRYVKEYQMMRELQGQSNIVSCDDFAVVPREDGIGGSIFIRMELLTPLPKAVKKEILSEEQVIRLGKDICRALILCEERNIIHRDIKPDNIMISRFGDFKLGDFGVARVQDHTTNATKMGTHGYAAPEVEHMQKYGKEADLYSLGITLYWLLNNRRMPLLRADEILNGTKVSEAMVRRYNGEPLPPPRDGSEGLKTIVLKACAYDAKDRYHSAEEMYQALEALSGEKAPESYRSAEGLGKVDSIQETMRSEAEGRTETNAWHDTNATIGQPMPRAGQSEVKDASLDKTMGATAAFQNQQKAQMAPKEQREAAYEPEDKRWHPTKVGYIWPLVPLAGLIYCLSLGETEYDASGAVLLWLLIGAVLLFNYAIYRVENKILRGICVVLKCLTELLAEILGMAVCMDQYRYWSPYLQLLFVNTVEKWYKSNEYVLTLSLLLFSILFTFLSVRRKKR